MINKLRKHMILIYTVSTSLILAIVLLIVLFILINQARQHDVDLFQNHIISVISRLQSSYTVNNAWFISPEPSDKLMVHIQMNSQPLDSVKGSWVPPTNRNVLIERAEKQAIEAEGIDINEYSLTLKKTSVYTVKGDHGESYFATIAVIPYDDDVRYTGILLLYLIDPYSWVTHTQIFLIVFSLFMGVVLFYLLSRYLVGKSLKPVEDSIQKQNEFIAAVSHELRSPLSVVQANISAVHVEAHDQKKMLATIQSECSRMSRLIEDMLLLASSDSGNWSVKPSPVEMDTLLIETYELFEPICRKKEVPLNLKLQDSTIPIIHADKERLKQALSILLDNAIGYSESKKGVTLRVYSSHKEVSIEVEDHGVGIPDEQKAQVFDRFYCIDKSRTHKSHFGLGLSIAYEIIRLHKGRILLKDTVGGGCTFVIILQV